jgi:hypothetical protein
MPGTSGTMRLLALLTAQAMGQIPLRVSRKVLPIKAPTGGSKHWIVKAPRYGDELGRCIEGTSPYSGAVPPNLCRYYGYVDITVEPMLPEGVQGTGECTVIELQVPIPAKNVEEAFSMFDEAADKYLANLKAAAAEQVAEVKGKPDPARVNELNAERKAKG